MTAEAFPVIGSNFKKSSLGLQDIANLSPTHYLIVLVTAISFPLTLALTTYICPEVPATISLGAFSVVR
jgi:hypothetical protein